MNEYAAAVLLVVFGALLATLNLLLLVLTPVLLSRLTRLAPARRTDAILFFRSLPLALATAAVLLIFLPAWWRHEPENTGETVSLTLLLLAVISAAPLFLGLARAARMFLRTRDCLLRWRRRGRSAGLLQSPFEVVAVPGRDVALCVGGYLRPTIYASADLMRSLDPAEFEAALAHEVSHATSRDPLRLLWMRSCPDFLQAFDLDGPWRSSFAQACEFTADALATRGNPEVALDLASALVKVARLRAVPAVIGEHGLEVAVSSAYSSPVDLRARVEALTRPDLAGSTPARWSLPVSLVCGLFLVVLGAAASERVHGVAESVGRFLAP